MASKKSSSIYVYKQIYVRVHKKKFMSYLCTLFFNIFHHENILKSKKLSFFQFAPSRPAVYVACYSK